MSVRTALGFQRIEAASGLLQTARSADFPLEALATAKSTLYRTPLVVLPAEVRLGRLLGRGAYGVAYRCTVFEVSLVVKVPLDVQVMGDRLPTRASVDECARNDFAQELRNAERLLEPLNYRGARLISPSNARALHDEMLQMRAHRGYNHIHRIVHGEINGAYPMLFSEPCEGTLWEKRSAHNAPLWTTDAPEWQALARQLLSAFDYTRTRGLYHLDIKPNNVFYIGPRYMLADFGRMTSSSEMMPRSARMLVDTLLVSLGDNLRYECTRIVPDPPFDAPLQQIAQRKGSVTDALMALWDALGMRDWFEPYPPDVGARVEVLEARRASWMPPSRRAVSVAVEKRKETPEVLLFDDEASPPKAVRAKRRSGPTFLF
jgi:serine/threonine protein kinase